MHIKFQQHVYQALLAEAIRQDKPLARLCNEILRLPRTFSTTHQTSNQH
jgi:hypothetical protein